MSSSKGVTVKCVNSIDAGMMRERRSHFELGFKTLGLGCDKLVIYSSQVAMEMSYTSFNLTQ